MARFSVVKCNTTGNVLKVTYHHDFGPFEFVFLPGENDKQLCWATIPALDKPYLADVIARKGLESLGKYAGKDTSDFSFADIVDVLQNL